ncbi:MAG: DUF3179 domain-containing (seleno)protein [Thermoanaerobaculia bacterium]
MSVAGRGRVLLAPALLAAACCSTGGYRTKPRVGMADGDPIVQMAPPAKFKSLDAPLSVPLRQHTDPPFEAEKVVGVSISDPPRMYPIGLLDTYEVVNDSAGSVPYVVARCALTGIAAVFDRRVGGRTLTFENSGALWRDTLVLRDKETGSYWTPATGRAISGPLAGETLVGIPAPLTTAEAWRELEPETYCLETGDLTAVPLRIRLYAASSWQGVSGEKTEDSRFPPKEEMFYVESGGEALAFTPKQLREKKRVETTLGGSAIVLEWDTGVRAPRAFRQIVDARQEVPVVSAYWFALPLHFKTVRTL